MTIMMNLKQLNQKLFMYKCSEAILNVILMRLNLNISIFIIIYEGDYEVKQLTYLLEDSLFNVKHHV